MELLKREKVLLEDIMGYVQAIDLAHRNGVEVNANEFLQEIQHILERNMEIVMSDLRYDAQGNYHLTQLVREMEVYDL
jgi:endo-beta-N-acetylglucosaminidase D